MRIERKKMKFCQIRDDRMFHGSNKSYHWYSVKEKTRDNKKSYELNQVNHLYQYDPDRAKKLIRKKQYMEFKGPNDKLWEPSGLNVSAINLNEEEFLKKRPSRIEEWDVDLVKMY